MKSTAKILFILAFLIGVATVDNAYASETSGTIVSGGNNGYAWSGEAGWMNFGATNGNIQITDSGIAGFVWNDNYGWINMAPTNGGVALAANGALSGYAWGSSLGWINFSGVTINSLGRFVGAASGTNVGTLTFDCTNCSVVTDYRPSSFRTVTPTPSTTVVPGGGGTILGSIPSAMPSHINAYNVPLEIDNDRQSGILTRGFTEGLSVGVDVPRGSIGGRIIINTSAIAIDQSTVTTATRVISNALFNVTATDGTGNPIHSFASPIRIALQVPEDLQGRSDIGVYFFDEANEWWERVPNVQFDGNIARFYVDHLTLFGIFSDSALPNILPPFFAEPSPSAPFAGAVITPEEGIGSFADGEIPAELAESLPSQLFDIRLLLDGSNISRVIDLVARVTFESFGRVPTPVSMTFAIYDEAGRDIWSSVDTVTVETEQVFVKRFFDAPTLVPGNYTLRLTTLYNTDVKDAFEAPFTIESEGAGWNWVPWFVGGLLLLLAVLVFVWWLIQRRCKEDTPLFVSWLIQRRCKEQEKKEPYTPFT